MGRLCDAVIMISICEEYINILKSESYYFENFPELFNHKYLNFKEFFYEAPLIARVKKSDQRGYVSNGFLRVMIMFFFEKKLSEPISAHDAIFHKIIFSMIDFRQVIFKIFSKIIFSRQVVTKIRSLFFPSMRQMSSKNQRVFPY